MINLFRNIISHFISNKRITKLYQLSQSKNWYECIAVCNQYILKGDESFHTYYYKGMAEFEVKSLDESIADLRKCLSVFSKKKSNNSLVKYANFAKYYTTMILRKQRKYDEAIFFINQSIDEDPSYIFFYILKAEIYSDQDLTLDAIDSINAGLKIEPKSVDLNNLQRHYQYRFSVEQNAKRFGG